jgi:hypothetical protein
MTPDVGADLLLVDHVTDRTRRSSSQGPWSAGAEVERPTRAGDDARG